MNEQDFGKKIAQTLDWGATQLADEKLVRLRGARQQAMNAYREPVSMLGLATVNGNMLDARAWLRKPLLWLPILAVALAVGYGWMNRDSGFDDVGELDAQLLTGELPIDAYLDKDFATWVKESAE